MTNSVSYTTRGANLVRSGNKLTAYMDKYYQTIDLSTGEVGQVHWDSHGFAGSRPVGVRGPTTDVLEAEYRMNLQFAGK